MTWEQRLLRARKAGEFTTKDKVQVGAWPTCAIGEKFHLRRNETVIGNTSIDSSTKILGLNFMHAVTDDDIYEAVRIYDRIHKVQK